MAINETEFYFDPSDPMSRLNALQESTLAKMAALQRGFEERESEIRKAAIPDIVKTQQLDALADEASALTDRIRREAAAELARIKAMPQPSKGVVSENKTISKEVAAELNKRYEGR